MCTNLFNLCLCCAICTIHCVLYVYTLSVLCNVDITGKFEIEDEAAEAAADLGKLPGWGSWGGAGIQANKRINKNKRGQRARRALAEEKKKKADELAKRQSIYPPNVIVNEEAIKHLPITKYQVSSLRF